MLIKSQGDPRASKSVMHTRLVASIKSSRSYPELVQLTQAEQSSGYLLASHIRYQKAAQLVVVPLDQPLIYL